MPRMARLIIYEADNEVLSKQIAKSLSEGIHNKGNITITVINLSMEPILTGFIDKTSKDFTNPSQA